MEQQEKDLNKPATSAEKTLKNNPKVTHSDSKAAAKPKSGTKEVVSRSANRPLKKEGKEQIWEKPNRSVATAKRADKPESRERGERGNTKFNRKNTFNAFNNVKQYEEKVVDIARVTKVVKGGRRFSFSAFVVVGDKKGKVGYGHGKANEVPDAIKKAVKDATNNLVTVPIYKKITVPHEINAKFLSSKVLLKPAPKGKGIIASGTVRAVVELAGYTDIYTKTYGSRSKANIVKATVEALKKLRMPEDIAAIRNKNVKDLLG